MGEHTIVRNAGWLDDGAGFISGVFASQHIFELVDIPDVAFFYSHIFGKGTVRHKSEPPHIATVVVKPLATDRTLAAPVELLRRDQVADLEIGDLVAYRCNFTGNSCPIITGRLVQLG